ncbi:MAG: site-specific integrase [Planctomycetaceae bacterium]|jgi:integrase|nr:site-specific integrase [Planctomycetaceae bacterium]
MQKNLKSPPKMGNNGGTAFVRIDGKRIYLGKFGSTEAAQNYARYVAEWSTAPTSVVPVGKCTVDTLAVAFLDYAKENYCPPDYSNYKSALRILLGVYSGCCVESFGPKCLKTVQKQLTEQKSKYGKPFSRQYCNKLTNTIKTVFRWGVAQELVPASIADALKYVQALRKGKTKAPETIPRLDVPDTTVQATLPYLPPIISAMIQIQRNSGMRPGEVCRMRVGDIDQSDEIWLYKPNEHKTAWRGHGKAVALGIFEQSLLIPYLADKKPDEFIFTPNQVMKERYERKAANRKKPQTTSRKTEQKHRAKHPKRLFADYYKPSSYAQAIENAIQIANRTLPPDKQIEHWTPYQLRHAKETELMHETKNPVITLAVMGQRSSSVLSKYDHSQVILAVEEAKKRKNRLAEQVEK